MPLSIENLKKELELKKESRGLKTPIAVDLSMKVYRAPIVLPRIEYDLGSAKLRDLAMKDLDNLVEVLETNPDLRIQLRSHTDFRSSDEFNKELSLKRAQSCVDYLIKNGIDASRLEPVGMGESEPLILTEDRNGFMKGDEFTKEFIEGIRSRKKRELAHQMNRRTDFKQIESDPEDAKLIKQYINIAFSAFEWDEVIKGVNKANEAGLKDDGKFALMKGIAYFEKNSIVNAKNSFIQALSLIHI